MNHKADVLLFSGLAVAIAVILSPFYIDDSYSLYSIPPTRAFDTIFNDNYPTGSDLNVTAMDFNDRFWITGNVEFYHDNSTVRVLGGNTTSAIGGSNVTIIEDQPINVTTIGSVNTIGLDDCNNAELYLFNTTADLWECEQAQAISAIFGLDNTERLYSHLAKGTAGEQAFTFGSDPFEYEIRFHSFGDGTGMGASNDYATWYHVAQTNFDPLKSLDFTFYYTSEKVGNGLPFCIRIQIWQMAANGGDLDQTLQAQKGFCDVTPPTPDILEKGVIVFSPSEHDIDPEDFVMFNLQRAAKINATDTGDYKLYTSDVEVRWNIP